MRTRKIPILLTTLLVVIAGIAGLLNAGTGLISFYNTPWLKQIARIFDTHTQQQVQERACLQLDKSLYKPGETIWFQAYLRNAADMKGPANSDMLHVQLIDPKGATIKQILLVADNGAAGGDFELPEEAPGGLYKIKAYTNWQLNDTLRNLIYEKEIQVQRVVMPRLLMKMEFQRKAYGPGDEAIAKLELADLTNKKLANRSFRYIASLDGRHLETKETTTDAEGIAWLKVKLPEDLSATDGLLNAMILHDGQTEAISRSIPITLNKITMEFFPEGGDMLAGMQGRVAFRALNEYKKPADVEGVIKDSKGRQVASFSSYHMGMGAFDLTPIAGEKYTASLTRPHGTGLTYTLPDALPAGYSMGLLHTASGTRVQIGSTVEEEMHVVVQMRDKIYFSGAFKARKGENSFDLNTAEMPMGVAQLTLFDAQGIARAERLVFVNKDKQMKLKITTDKEQYLPREKVTMTIQALDGRGIPMPAQLSLAVVDEKNLTFADDKTGTILSRMFLEPELKQPVEEAKFYFDPKEEKADTALDYLLLTSGWRRYTWKEIQDNKLTTRGMAAERAEISGTVHNAGDGNKPLPGARLTIPAMNNRGEITTCTDAQGKYSFRAGQLTFPFHLQVSADSFPASTQYVHRYGVTDLYIQDNAHIRRKQAEAKVQAEQYRLIQKDEIQMAAPRMHFDNVQMNEVQGVKANKFNVKAVRAQNAPMVVEKKQKAINRPLPPAVEEIAGQAVRDMADAEMIQEDLMIEGLAQDKALMKNMKIAAPQPDRYYRAREFPAPVYDSTSPGTRTDFRSTIYWKGNIETGKDGKATLSFYNNDDVTAFRATVEGFGIDGAPAHAEYTYFTQMPFSMSAKIPAETAAGDKVDLTVILKNNTNRTLTGTLSASPPAAWAFIGHALPNVSIGANEVKTITLSYQVQDQPGLGQFELSFSGSGMSDAISQEVRTGRRGFPAGLSFSGEELDKEYAFMLSPAMEGTLEANLTAYPNMLDEMMTDMEAMLREPNGCFEQTSSSNYPNILALQYIKATGQDKPALVARAMALLDKGYKKLTAFETSQKGYEWFGQAPAHEALTAYGLLEFNDMKEVYPEVSTQMIARTAEWIDKRKDGKGGFQRKNQALDDFGRASENTTNAYIVYAMAAAGYTNIKKELDAAAAEAARSKDAYRLGLVANALYTMKDSRASQYNDMLWALQKENGSFPAGEPSVTYTTGQGLEVETSALAVMSMLKAEKPERKSLASAVKFIIGRRNGGGGFANTQSTIMALKALTEFSIYNKRPSDDGNIEVYIDGKKVSSRHYTTNDKGEIQLAGLEKFLTDGKHTLRVKYSGTRNPLPYSVDMKWRTTQPNSQPQCKVSLSSKLSADNIKTGETVRLSSVLSNVTQEGLPSTIAIIGIPGGLGAQPWQLKELQEKGVFDYYEVRGNNVIAYYRNMKPGERREINLDLKAEVPGSYEAPASTAYLYYTAEHKNWCQAQRITVSR